jgi:hypothetical protein
VMERGREVCCARRFPFPDSCLFCDDATRTAMLSRLLDDYHDIAAFCAINY